MVRIRLQRALVPDLRKLIVAELAVGIADQVGHVRLIVLAQRLELVDRGGIIVALVDRVIGCAVASCEGGIIETGLLGALLALVGGGGLGARRRRSAGRRRGHGFTTSTTAPAASAASAGCKDRR